jgi:AbrB family looped-hinge helix DNA binding protein
MAVAKSKAKELGIARVRKKKQITLPDAVMEALQLREGQELRFVVKGGRVYLEPVVTVRVPPDEAYAFTPEWQTMIRRSLEDVRAGRAFTVRAEEIPTLIERLKKEGKL